ncbi:MAG: hypothetical protein ACI4PO_01110 [Faecousia sp.]
MRKDTTFSDRKLTRAEFSRKYWLGGVAPYQYHTAEIEDGRDEREQFLINNVRALKDMNTKLRRMTFEALEENRKEASTAAKRATLALAGLNFLTLAITVAHIRHDRRKRQSP